MVRSRYGDTHLLIVNLAFTLLDDLDQVLLDSLLERARDLVGTLELLALLELLASGGTACELLAWSGSHCV